MSLSKTPLQAKTPLQDAFDAVKTAYHANPYPTYGERKAILNTLKKSLLAHEAEIYDAICKDYGYRSDFDSLIGDVLPTVTGINYALKNLKKWMRPSKRHAGLVLMPSTVRVHYQPLGVVGVITPWNFPFFLSLSPAVQALAAGNRVMIKMSEFTPHTNEILRKVIAPLSDHIVIIEGGADVGAEFAKLPFDHLIFTGSSAVGKLVAQSAAENLTPITLELGGKSPTIIDNSVNMNRAIDAIIMGKSVNGGQICVAPDYIFVRAGREQEFIDTFQAQYTEYHLNDDNTNQQTHILTDQHLKRLQTLLTDAKTKGATIHPIKAYQTSDKRRLYPHIITNVTDDMQVMQDEIFGAILPIITYTNIDEVITYINNHPRPLALYIMSSNNATIDKIIKGTHSGGIAINDTTTQTIAHDAPFGGIGNSGMGQYHGHEGFKTFSHAKTTLKSPTWLPKNKIILKHRDTMFKIIRKLLLR